MEHPEPTPSAIGAGLLVLGDQWNLLILQQAFTNHVRRFADWHRALAISESVLAGRLKELVVAGVLEPTPYRTDGRARTEYRLSEKGLPLWAFLVAIWSWERAWVESPAAQVTLEHVGCSGATDVLMACSTCGSAPITARDTAVDTGPDTGFGHVAVPRHHRRTARTRDHTDPHSYQLPTLEILGDRWSTVVLVAAFIRVRRFADFQSVLGIAPGVLSDRLRRFVELGVFVQRPEAEDPGEYRLTAKGLAFFPVFAFLVQWSQDWFPRPDDGGLIITHQACAARLRAHLQCTTCGQPVERRDVRFVPVTTVHR